MMQIFVKPYYRTLTLTVKPSDTVAIVKSMIQTKLSNEEAIPSFKMTLAYAGNKTAPRREDLVGLLHRQPSDARIRYQHVRSRAAI